MRKPYQKFKINRNILLLRWMNDRINVTGKVNKTFHEAAEHWLVSPALAKKVYHEQDYPYSPYIVHDKDCNPTGEKRSLEDIIEFSNDLKVEMKDFLNELESRKQTA